MLQCLITQNPKPPFGIDLETSVLEPKTPLLFPHQQGQIGNWLTFYEDQDWSMT